MYKVLIVDDEMIVRHAVKTLIRWEGSRFTYSGSASSGASALKMVREQHPDIVITDIKMPEMDGIELIKQLMASGFDGEILVLSNFNDFELVREALKCGAHDYMLKLTLKSDNFMQTLNEIASKLDEKKRQPGVALTVERKDQTNRIHDLLLALRDSVDAAQLPGLSPEVASELLPPGHGVTLFAIQVDTAGEKRDETSLTRALSQLWSDIYPGSSWQCTVAEEERRFLLAAAYPADTQTVEPAEMPGRIASLAAMYYSLNVDIVYGKPAFGLEELIDEMRRCRKARTLLFYQEAGRVCLPSDTEAAEYDPAYERMESEWTEDIRTGRPEFAAEWEQRALRLIREGAARRLLPRVVKRTICEAMWTLSRKPGLEQRREFDPSLWLERITGAASDTELLMIASELSQEVLALAESGIALRANRPEIRKALAYLEEHYAKPVSIRDVASHVNLSETYLCQIFKTQTGKSIMTYLNELRMAKAYELLSSGQLLVKEAAAEVGIHDPFYFNRLFKKHFGIAPKHVKPKENPALR